jgi:hypothetical protein
LFSVVIISLIQDQQHLLNWGKYPHGGSIMHQIALPVIGLLLSIAGYQVYRDIRRVKNWQTPTTPSDAIDGMQTVDCEISHPITQVSDVASGLAHLAEHLGHLGH